MLENLNLPVFKEQALVEEETFHDRLQVKITSVKLEKDPFGEPNTLTLGLTIVNKTDKTFFDFFNIYIYLPFCFCSLPLNERLNYSVYILYQ